jgi:hypothetical protein
MMASRMRQCCAVSWACAVVSRELRGPQEAPAVAFRHGGVLSVLDQLLNLAGEAPQGLNGQLAGDETLDGEARSWETAV